MSAPSLPVDGLSASCLVHSLVKVDSKVDGQNPAAPLTETLAQPAFGPDEGDGHEARLDNTR